MPIYNQPNFTAGIDDALIDVAREVGAFIPMTLFFIWFVIFLGGVVAQGKRKGSSDFPMWSAIASIGTLLVALPMTLTLGLIPANVPIIAIILAVTIFSGVWLFLDRNRNEV
ncbi:unnamed protein product [marine sediment metagenome]|uniref:Uncharacterized protein n=1 Tax=marine sediment metagenome TaxID=412755 RepID=X0URQ5_9ZZZZ